MPTNREVAQRFIQFIDHPQGPRGPSGKLLSTQSGNLGASTTSTPSGPLFFGIAACISYATRVAALVRNAHARRVELWLHPETWSPTTARHMSEIRSAYDAYCRDKALTPHVFRADPISALRADPVNYTALIEGIPAVVAQADLPRLQERTRYAALGTAITHIDRVLHLMTDGLPVPGSAEAHQYLGGTHDRWALTIAKLWALRGTIVSFQDLPLERMRPAVRAWIELTNAKG